MGIQCKLHIATTGNLQFLDEFDGRVVQHLQVVIVERHNGRNNHTVTGVDANGVDIFHAADGDGVVFPIAHNLKLDLLVALDGLFDQNLVHRRKFKSIQTDLNKFFLAVCEAAAGTAKGKRRSQNNRIANALCRFLCFVNGICNLRGDDRLTNGLAQFLEHLPVLGPFNGSAGGAQQFHPAFLQNSLLLQLHNQVQAGLSTDTGQNSVRALIADNFGNIF